jgi:hypothetical protein
MKARQLLMHDRGKRFMVSLCQAGGQGMARALDGK